jgi:hypothetical protein
MSIISKTAAAAAVLLLFCMHSSALLPSLKRWSAVQHGARRPHSHTALPAGAVDEWVLRNGGIIGGIKTEIMTGSLAPASEREVLASRTIRQGEVVLAIPRQCILTKAKAELTPLGQALLGRGETLSNDGAYLTLLLCEELVKGRRNEPSDIDQYVIRNLPTRPEFDHLPLFWSEEELGELRGSTVLAFLDIRKQSIDADYALLCDCSAAFKSSISEEDFWWL